MLWSAPSILIFPNFLTNAALISRNLPDMSLA